MVYDLKVPAKVKRRMYKTKVRLAILYGTATVVVIIKKKEKMEEAKGNILMYSIRKTNMDKVRNGVVGRET